jgi:hypothetical protein
MPTTEHGKAIASRNATTHGVFARDIVLPSLGEDPGGYQQVQDELVAQLRPGNLLERHYVEKIAAASWRLRRLHRWQAQLFEDDTLTEDTRLDKLDKVLRHETALQRQIDTAVRMLAKDVPNLYARRAREEALDSLQLSERECLADGELDMGVSMETRNRMYQLRKSTNQAVNELSVAPLDTPAAEPDADAACAETRENCQNEPDAPKRSYHTLPRRSRPPAASPLAPQNWPSQERSGLQGGSASPNFLPLSREVGEGSGRSTGGGG